MWNVRIGAGIQTIPLPFHFKRGPSVPMYRRSESRWEPAGGWPLNHVLVGVATLRTLRELYRRQHRSSPNPDSDPLRAWDVASRAAVTVQGAANSLERLEKAGLVQSFPPLRHGGAARYRLDPSHPLVPPLGQLFGAERRMVPPHRPYAPRQRR